MQHSEAFLKLVEESKKKIKETTVEEVFQRLSRGESFHFIDVREDHEWASGHAKGASHLGKGIIERDIEAKIPDKKAEVILYCGGGFRSALAAEALQKMGYTRVVSMDGGIRAWKEKGFPIE